MELEGNTANIGLSEMDAMFQINFSSNDIENLRIALSDMTKPVTIYTFVSEDCRFCGNTVKLINTLVEASPTVDGERLIKHIVVDRRNDPSSLFEKFRVDRVPTVAMLEGYIRYTGMPAGEEIRGLVETIIRISREDSGLSNATVEKIAALKGEVHIEVIVTPTCPYCPYAALLANMFAYESYRSGNRVIIGDTVEAYENPDIADAYGVMSVPTVVINKSVEFVGPPYKEQLLEKVIEHSEKVWKKKKRKEELMKLLKELEE